VSNGARIYFVRHGESVSNAGGITMAHADIALTPRGQAQAIAVAEQLPAQPSRVLSSAFLRARQTARPYCDRVGATVEVQPLLNEFSALDPALLWSPVRESARTVGASLRTGPAVPIRTVLDAKCLGRKRESPDRLSCIKRLR
jgi:phosphohistidine phosphatase SixA